MTTKRLWMLAGELALIVGALVHKDLFIFSCAVLCGFIVWYDWNNL